MSKIAEALGVTLSQLFSKAFRHEEVGIQSEQIFRISEALQELKDKVEITHNVGKMERSQIMSRMPHPLSSVQNL